MTDVWRIRLSARPSDSFEITQGNAKKVLVADLRNVEIKKGLIWDALVLRCSGETFELRGLSTKRARELEADLKQFCNNWFAQVLSENLSELDQIDSAIAELTREGQRYLSKGDIGRFISETSTQAAAAISHPFFEVDLLGAELAASLPEGLEFLTDPNKRDAYNTEFLEAELEAFTDFFDTVIGRPLNDEQREACIRLEDTNLLIAAAGSGKTATIVSKVAYLLKKDLEDPKQILVLAYNNSAAKELRERVADILEVKEKDLDCTVSTFHALGRSILSEVNNSPPKLASWVAHNQGGKVVVGRLIKTLCGDSPDFSARWSELISLYPKADLPVELFDQKEEYERYISDVQEGKASKVATLVPDLYVRSLQERAIVNWLWTHSVDFQYEKQIAITPEGGEEIFFQPDFYFPETETFYEHFALNEDGTSPFEGYAQQAKDKRALYAGAGLDFFESTSAQHKKGALFSTLESELEKREIPLVRRPEEDIQRAAGEVIITLFHNLLATCLSHTRAGDLSREILRKRAEIIHDRNRAYKFIDVLLEVRAAYDKKLKEEEQIDFDSMISDATASIENGAFESPFSLIFVDEFQDISEPRANLIKALQNQRPFTKLFVVGDDWQSIYRFAGSDITVLTRFTEHFGQGWQGNINTTYRSNGALAKAAASFIQRNPDQLKKQIQADAPEIPKCVRAVPVDLAGSTQEHAVLHHLGRLNQFGESKAGGLGRKVRVMVLARYNFVLKNLEEEIAERIESVEKKYPHLEVSLLTFHRSKGLEADYTILVDISEGSHGVPSRIEDDELLKLVIPLPENFPYAEERRLFYVALTRAMKGTFLIFDADNPSRYLDELRTAAPEIIQWDDWEGNALPSCEGCSTGFKVPRYNSKTSTWQPRCSNFPTCNHEDKLPAATG